MVGLKQQVVTPDGQHYLLLLVDDMRSEHQRFLQSRRVHDLQHHVKSMAMQLVGVMDLNEMHVLLTLVGKGLQRLRERTLATLRQTYDRYLYHSGCKGTAFCRHTQSLFMGIFALERLQCPAKPCVATLRTRDRKPLLRRVYTVHLRTYRHHVEVRIFLEEQTAFETRVNG